MGTVASETLGASVAPTIEPVAKITAAFAPVNACAAASRMTLERTRTSPAFAAAAVISIIGYFHPKTAGYRTEGFDFAHYEAADLSNQPMETGERHAPVSDRNQPSCERTPT
jgi:hypothetical protein